MKPQSHSSGQDVRTRSILHSVSHASTKPRATARRYFLNTILVLSLLIAANASAFTLFTDNFNRTATISEGTPLGTGWAPSTSPSRGGTWSIGTAPAGAGYAQPDVFNTGTPTYNAAQYVPGVDLSTEGAWTECGIL